MTWASLIEAVIVASLTFAILQQADRGLWYQACLIKGAGSKIDSDELIRAGTTFIVWWKIIPAACTALTFAVAIATHQITWLIIAGACLVSFVASSLVYAMKRVTQVSNEIMHKD